MKVLEKIKEIIKGKEIFFLLVIGLLGRLFLAPYGTLNLDFNSWLGWSHRLTEVGLAKFYGEWSDYLPGYLYILWFLGWLKSIFPHFSNEILYKLPSILADLVTTYLIFSLVKNLLNGKKALLASVFYLFNPAVLANSTLWGQADSFSTMLVFSSFYLLWKEKYLLSPVFLSLAVLTKPQSIIFLPFVFLVLLLGKERRKILSSKNLLRNILAFFLFILVFLLAFVPFSSGQNIFSFITERLRVTLEQYPYTSVNAFNFWFLSSGFWQSDSHSLLFLSLQQWGVFLFSFMTLSLLVFLWKKWNQNQKANFKLLFLVLAMVAATAFLFLTRVHERHLFPLFAFLAVAAASKPKLWLLYLFYSLTYLLNLRFSFIWINQGFKEIFSQKLIGLFSFTNLVLFIVLLSSLFRTKLKVVVKKYLPQSQKLSLPKEGNLFKKHFFKLIIILLLFAALTRFYHLGQPKDFYFDEVYHAFTAVEMVKGNPAAWEWWNTPPEGMAYEWSHPPLAKLSMAAGVLLFGQQALGWRFFGALLGIGCVFLVYLLGKEIFNRKVGILAASLFVLDGLPLVISRIGMNDIYFLFFGLLALWLFLKNRYLFSGLAFGLSLASKWTAIYWFLVFGFCWLLQFLKEDKKRYFSFLRQKFLVFLVFFLVLPFGVYLLSYLPFFLSHHSFSQWWELQRQMWWYHTGLKATHPFTSPWWSWLIMKRPVWLFVKYGQEKIANIYAMGNPLVWWGGLVSLPWVTWLAIRKRSEKLGLVVFAYWALFLPWAFSPRIMFIYHYLPAIPFLSLFLAWFLLWLAKKKEFKPIFISYLLLVAVVFLFFYPHWAGLEVAKWWNNLYYWLPSWR